jgi:sugar O-acyltransferase (sialic acid O-acetyltransferase NeuD family)
MKKYFVEKFNAADDSFKVTDVYFNLGTLIKSGDIIFSIESSKADIDIESEESGYLYYIVTKGDIIHVGELFYLISKEKIDNYIDLFEIKIIEKIEGYIISKKANVLLAQYELSPSVINKKIIKEIDVIDYVNKKISTIEKFDKKSLLPYDKNLTPVIIIGAGGGAKMVIDAVRDSKEYVVVGLLDDNLVIGTEILGVPVVGRFNNVDSLLENSIYNFVIAFGVLENRKYRFELYLALKEKGCSFPNIIHPKAIVEKSVKMGEGNVVLAGSNIGSSVILGNLNYINNNALISHDCKFIDNIHIAPSAVLASSIRINSHTLVGMNATLYYGIQIGESTTILNGLIINCDIENDQVIKSNKYDNR